MPWSTRDLSEALAKNFRRRADELDQEADAYAQKGGEINIGRAERKRQEAQDKRDLADAARNGAESAGRRR